MTVPFLTSVYVLGPALALGFLVLVGALLRWIFSDALSDAPPAAPAIPAEDDDYGLLRAAALVDDVDTGESVRALLAAARVRATVATGRDGIVRVLVFPDEYDRAVRLVSWVL